ncbi:hypothetical protein [Franzmannia qiaohouensis]|uniref:Uncharacterized protein n=1 Tax=Franzmannia qiaohouensis TaxID=1329370 RepID=A0ABU1HJV9_9GAMM|nr:hypothetical protein [Halomonas qiaohouensis]MDR5907773.1 hypothetical protein [Halomonas qiaohouensis]
MKDILRRVFWPILRFFETSENSGAHKKSHRVALNIVGVLFILLSFGSAVAGYTSGQIAAFIPVLVFFSVGLVAVVLGTLGSNAAVSKIWGVR